jgi:hypothetical protein
MNEFSDRVMYEQAAANFIAFVVAADKFLRDRGTDPADLYRYFGETYASEWDHQRGDIDATAQSVALNMTSGGLEASTVTENGGVTVHSRWTDQHDGWDWPTPVKPALERAVPMLFEHPMAHVGIRMTARTSSNGIDLLLATPGG